jgi:hypothetical protein
VGIVAMLVAVAFGWSQVRAGSWSPVSEFGVASLFVYWIHVEMVYGVLSAPLHRALTFEQAIGAMLVFTLFLFGLVRLKRRLTTSPTSGEKSTEFESFRASPAPHRPHSS